MTQENTQTTNVVAKKEKIIKGIACPSCSGELDLKEGMKTFNCKYCGTLLVAKGDSGTIKYYVPKSVKREQAIANAYKWLDTGLSKAKGLKSNSKIDEAFSVFVPYWRIRADVVGWVFGQEKRTSANNTTTYEDKEIKIQNSLDRTIPACDIAELGVRKVNLEGDEIRPVDFETIQSEGMLFNIISSEKEISEKVLENFTNQALSAGNLDTVTFKHFDVVRQNISIIYYPLWVVRYVYQGRTYQVIVDGQDGSICYGKAPGNNLFRAVAGVIGTGVGMFLLTFFEIFKILGASSKFTWIVYFILAFFGVGILMWSWKKFRYGGEVEEGSGLVADAEVSMVQKTGSFIKSKTGVGFTKGALGSLAAGAVIGSIFDND